MWGRARCAVAHRLTRHCTRLALFSALTATHVALSRGFAIVTASASRPPLDASNMDPHAYTALPIAAARALSSERSAGVQDPLARKLVAGEDQLLRAGANVEYMTKRALIGDELVLEQHGKGVRQVVSLGAGMDSRAFRLGLNDTVFYEVDKSGLFDVKEPLVASDPLQAAGRRLVVGTIGVMDLQAKLEEAGFDRSLPTTWLMEGLAPYLTVDKMEQLARDVGTLSAAGSALWLDGFSKTSVDSGMYFHGVKFESGFDDYDELWLSNGFDRVCPSDYARYDHLLVDSLLHAWVHVQHTCGHAQICPLVWALRMQIHTKFHEKKARVQLHVYYTHCMHHIHAHSGRANRYGRRRSRSPREQDLRRSEVLLLPAPFAMGHSQARDLDKFVSETVCTAQVRHLAFADSGASCLLDGSSLQKR